MQLALSVGCHARYPVVRCLPGDAGHINIGGGESIRLPKKKTGFRPRVDLTKEQAVQLQLEVTSTKSVTSA